MRVIAFAAVVVIALLLTPQAWHQQSHAQPSQPNSQASKDQANDQPANTSGQQSSAQVNEESEAARRREQQERDAKEAAFKAEQLRQNRIVVWATVFIAISGFLSLLASFIYAMVSVKTLRAVKQQANSAGEQVAKMQEQLTLMSEQTEAIKAQAEASEISAKAAETSAVAAKQTAEVALKSFITAERPEIYFKRTQLYPLEIGKQTRAMFLACNGGRITAYKVAIEFNYCAPPRALFAFDNVLPWDDVILDRIDVLPPEADMTVRPSFGFEPTEIDLIGLGNGVLSLYIYGRMRYEDGYGREYTMSFYRQYNPQEPLELTYAPQSVKTKADHEAEKHRRREQARSPDSGT